MDLRKYFTGKSGVAIGLSGGADSALLLWAARKYAEDVTPYFASTVFGHPGDRESAEAVCDLLGLDLRVVTANGGSSEPSSRPHIATDAVSSPTAPTHPTTSPTGPGSGR